MPRLGGEYIDPADGDQSQAVQHGRLIFLGRVERIAPEVLEGLRDDVLPAYTEWAGADADPETMYVVLDAWFALPAVLVPCPELDALKAALGAWSGRWHLSDAWTVQDALWTAETWRAHPQTLDYDRLYFHGAGWAPLVHELDVEPCPAFKPTMETWREFEVRVDEWKRACREAAARLAADRGLKLAPQKRARRGGDAGEHFEWLARFQVQEWSPMKIAFKYEVEDETTVRKALASTAERIGLTLRK